MLKNIDRETKERVIVLSVLMIIIIIPSLVPIGFPLKIGPYSQSAYDFVDNLEPGSIVMLSMDIGTMEYVEVRSGIVAMIKHIFQKDLRLVALSFGSVQGPSLIALAFTDVDMSNEVYGVDYVELGYFAGGESSLVAFVDNVADIAITDLYGTPISEIPLMNDLQNVDDIALVVKPDSGNVDMYIRQMNTPHGTPIIGLGEAYMYSQYVNFFQNHFMVGFLSGIRLCAEYELLLHAPFLGASSMDIMMMTHLYALALIAISNVLLRTRKMEGGI